VDIARNRTTKSWT